MNKRLAAWSTGLCLVTASVAGQGTASASSTDDSARTAAVIRHLDANLQGGPTGDPNGSGHASFRLNRAAGKVCAKVRIRKVGTKPTAAHIHRRSTDAIVVGLTGSVTGGPNCNPHVRRKLIKKILRHPGRFYFNVHSAKYPAGAIRGRLHR
jgi:hypothetical protein